MLDDVTNPPSTTTGVARPRVAVVGGGIAGIGAALGLQHACDTTVFEASGQLGGHILPAPAVDPQGRATAVDTGFVVFIPDTYPKVTALLASLGVAHAPAPTRFCISDETRGITFEPGELLKMCGKALPRQSRRDLLKLHQALARIRTDGLSWIANVPLSEWVQELGFVEESVALGVLPWIASFWGLQPETVRTVSARVALREIARNAGPRPMHRVVPSTAVYLDALVAALGESHVEFEAVERIETRGSHATVVTRSGSQTFDRVVVAVDAIDARRLLVDAPAAVSDTLGRFGYEPTVAVLHHDTSRLPQDKARWRTFHHQRRTDPDRVRSVTTWVMDLLHEWESGPDSTEIGRPTLLSTGDRGLVDGGWLRADAIDHVWRHRHLVMTPDVVDALDELPNLDDGQRFTLAGSYCALGGLHEDALASGVRAAEKVCAEVGTAPPRWPWST